jgi:NAD(P)-dependent dehydrogenase (short-subunit alcohol dehydrogenase family)
VGTREKLFINESGQRLSEIRVNPGWDYAGKVGRDGGRVNAIAPGLTDTAQPRYGSSEAEIVEMARSVPLGRMAQPDEIAQAAVFLASENAGFVTGQTLHVNGGSYLA